MKTQNIRPKKPENRKEYQELYTWWKSKIESIYTWTERTPEETHKRVWRIICHIPDLEEPEYRALVTWDNFCYMEESSAIYKS